jgi:hypothetical protein
MNFNSGGEARKLGYDTRNQGHVGAVQPMRKPMQEHRVEARIAEEYFENTLRRRVFAKDRIDLFPNRPKHVESAS